MSGTVFALSSGAPPAGIAVVRVSGPDAAAAIRTLVGRCPSPRRASVRNLRDADGVLLDRGMVLWFPGPASATGEDCAEFHLHGGRAVIDGVLAALATIPGLQAADPGAFTRRAFANGRLDLAETEGLADLLAAETEAQRRAALMGASGQLSTRIEEWRDRLLVLSARVEAELDFSDDADQADAVFHVEHAALTQELDAVLARPPVERLREGFRIVLAGPPNAGKSTLLNRLTDTEAAIATPIAGTTRDVMAVPVAWAGQALTFVDTAGVHDDAADPVEKIGIERAHQAIATADLVLWLGRQGAGAPGAWEIEAQTDRLDSLKKPDARHRVSAVTGAGIDGLRQALADHAATALPGPGEMAFNRRQRALLRGAADALRRDHRGDVLLQAENLREARQAFDAILGRTATEDMLDTLFGRFCIGK